MKICVLHSSYEGSSSVFEEYGESPYQDPRLYVPPDYHHEFSLKYIKKATAKEQLDSILNSGAYEMYWNFMWGTDDYGHDVAGLEATRYLEERGISFIGPSSKFSAMSKVDAKRAVAALCGEDGRVHVRTPKWTLASALRLDGLKFPVVAKPAIGCASEYMTKTSVCQDECALNVEIARLRSRFDAQGLRTDVLIEEFVPGKEISINVLETVTGVVPMTPIIYEFPAEWTTEEKFLHFENKWELAEKFRPRLFDEDPAMLKKLSDGAVSAFCALGVRGSGYARLDFRISDIDGEPYLLEVNQVPAFFAFIGNPDGDDELIERTFPGGHAAFIDTIIAAKLKLTSVSDFFDNLAGEYDNKLQKFANPQIGCVMNTLWDKFDFRGSILDLGAGAGTVGMYILKKRDCTSTAFKAPPALFTAIELSPQMASFCAQTYSQVYMGRMENVTLELAEAAAGNRGSFDHVVSILLSAS